MSCPNVLISSEFGPIVINVNDSVIGKYISQLGYWAKDDIELISQLINFLLLKKDSVIFYDVGANIGTHSLAIAKKFNDKIKIRAFEAQRSIFYMLCGTIALNGLRNVHCHNLAVSDSSLNKLKIPLPNYSEVNNFGGLELIPPLVSDNQAMSKKYFEDVDTATLDSFEEVVDFIKMDIEGMEDKAFLGAQSIIANHRPICFVEILKTDKDFLFKLFLENKYIGFVKNDDLIAIPIEHQIEVNGLQRIF